MHATWKESCDKSRQSIKKQRHHFADKGLNSQSYSFSSSHVWMWELDYKKGWKCYSFSHVQFFVTHGLKPARLLCPCNSPGKNTGVDCYFLLQGIFLTQGSIPGLLHCRKILYCLSHQGRPHKDAIYLCKQIDLKVVTLFLSHMYSIINTLITYRSHRDYYAI